jgi:hypothetical protein
VRIVSRVPIIYGDFKTSELAYAVTGHAAQSRTVHTGMAVITSDETASAPIDSMPMMINHCTRIYRW